MRKMIARMLVKMEYEPHNSRRNFRHVYEKFGMIVGVEEDTFLGYTYEDLEDLSDVEMPWYVKQGLWQMVQLSHEKERPMPPELLRRLNTPIPHRRRRKREPGASK